MSNPNVANLTITAITGPADTVTALVLNNIRSLTFNFGSDTITVVDQTGKTQIYELQNITTVTYTISSHTATISIS